MPTPSTGLPLEIQSGLISLRRRIRHVQVLRGLLRTALVFLAGLFLLIALDYFFAPLSWWFRTSLFFLWLASIVLAISLFMIRPLMTRLSLHRLARWLELRHPETEERISSTIEFSDSAFSGRDQVSPALLAELSREAVFDIAKIDPQEEVRTRRIRPSLFAFGAGCLLLLGLFLLWPPEMGRLLTRALSPLSDLGNAGAVRFEIQPGEVEILEGEKLAIQLTYTGPLDEPLQFLMEKDGESFAETLQPIRSQDDQHTFLYHVHAADRSFHYSARVAGDLSDRFEARVYPLPRLRDPIVTLKFPSYTGWPDREQSLGNGVQALTGSEVTIRGRFESPLESAELLMDSPAFGQAALLPSADADDSTELTWTGIFPSELDAKATVKVKHFLGPELEVSVFSLKSIADPAPLVKLLTPRLRSFRVKADEQVIMTYEVIEALGLAKAEIELQVNGQMVDPLRELLPERSSLSNPGEWDGRERDPSAPRHDSLWNGEAMVFLGSLVSQHPDARTFKMRLALHDQRPAELAGPGVGYSEWLEFQLDPKAPSLVRQELEEEARDIRENVGQAIREIQEAKRIMQQAKRELHHAEVTQRSEKALSDSREKLTATQENLNELSERMKQGVQEHRRKDVQNTLAKLDEAKQALEKSALQDRPESRKAQVDQAHRKSQEAVTNLRELQQELRRDEGKLDDLARLQEMAQRQEALAREASAQAIDQIWQNKQRQLREEIRRKVQQSPQAKAAAMKAQSERAAQLAKEAATLEQAQKALAKLAPEQDAAAASAAVRAAELAEEIQSIPEIEGNALAQAKNQAEQASQKSAQASQSQQAGQASKQHQQAAEKLGQVSQSLTRASRELAQRAAQAAQQSENPQKAPAPAAQMAEALQQSAQAAQASARASESQKASSSAQASAQAAAQALRAAAQQAKEKMKRGGEAGAKTSQAAEESGPADSVDPGQAAQEAQEARDAEEGPRLAQSEQGVPPELAKLGISTSDWEKIKANMNTDLSGSAGTVIPDDYRQLVKKYFEQMIKEQ